MRFGATPLAEAEGGILAHAVRAGALLFKKGSILGAEEIVALRAAGVESVTVALIGADDVPEDRAAAKIAASVAGAGVRIDRAFTGRANLFAAHAGVLVVDRASVDQLNRLDEAVTFASLPAFKAVEAGEMVATVKIIPYAAPGEAVAQAEAVGRLIEIKPYRLKRVAVISTLLPSLTDKVIDKTLRVTAARLAPAGAEIVQDIRVPHEAAALSPAITTALSEGADLVLIFGASAIADRRDVIPAGLVAAGGEVAHLGMPVDPGNLLMVGAIGAVPVIGAPGCARSPKENGFDWVLTRLLAGLPVTKADITGMGVGGLLMEIVSRPQPRAADEPDRGRVTALILAAGKSSRMGGPNKLVARLDGKPLVRHAAEAALASHVDEVVVVTGHQGERVREALAGLPLRFVDNPRFAEGLSTSLTAGIEALDEDVGAA
ncbi:MAG: NTP transferase domain-containing protein, partial [Alphaproteobacteria bacterium]